MTPEAYDAWFQEQQKNGVIPMDEYRSLRRRAPKREKKKTRIFYYDIESWGLNPADDAPLICVTAERPYTKWMEKYDKDGWTFITDEEGTAVNKFKAFLERLPKGKEHLFYGHNGNDFDLYCIANENKLRDNKKLASDTRIFKFEYDLNIHFRDSKHLLPLPLSKLGAKGVTPDMFIDPEHPDWKNPAAIDQTAIEYCRQDVRVLRSAIIGLRNFFREITGYHDARLPLTAAGMAYEVFCAKYWPDEWSYWSKKSEKRVYTVSFEEKANEAARKAYFGGRTQVMDGYAGQTVYQVDSFDRNSMYPSEMRFQRFPNPNKIRQIKNPTTERVIQLIKEERCFWGFFQMTASEDAELFLPVLQGYHTKYDSTEIDGFYCSPEITYAVNNGWTINNCTELWYSRDTVNPFEKFVDDLYTLRQEYKAQNDPRQEYVKLLLNSLYGKFGSKDRPERIEDRDTIDRIKENIDQTTGEELWKQEWTQHFWSVHDDTDYLVSKEMRIRPSCVFMPVAAFITSYARVNLQSQISACRKAGFDVVYCDTDSVHLCNLTGQEIIPMQIGKELGQWDLERPKDWEDWVNQPIPQAVYWERKSYLWMDDIGQSLKTKHKGANRSDGDLTKPQMNVSVLKYKQALRTGQKAGYQVETIKRSKEWCK